MTKKVTRRTPEQMIAMIERIESSSKKLGISLREACEKAGVAPQNFYQARKRYATVKKPRKTLHPSAAEFASLVDAPRKAVGKVLGAVLMGSPNDVAEAMARFAAEQRA